MLGRVLKDAWRAWRAPRSAVPPSTAAAAPSAVPVVMRYRPEVFDVADETAARGIILTPEGEASTQARWEHETPYLVRLAAAGLSLEAGTRVVDFGCGIGRLARELIATTGCTVVGVDISASMRRLAAQHVGSTSFEAIDPEKLIARTAAGERADAAIACWVLQHCMDPKRDIDTVARALRPGGRLMVVNNLRRAVPSDGGWIDDGLDIAAMLDARFRCLTRDVLDASAVGTEVARHTFVAIYEPR